MYKKRTRLCIFNIIFLLFNMTNLIVMLILFKYTHGVYNITIYFMAHTLDEITRSEITTLKTRAHVNY